MDNPVEPRLRIRTIVVFSILLALLGVIVLFAYFATFDRPVTTIILVRHAEKKIEPDNPDPDLSPTGELRAQELARMLTNAGINTIFATQFKRTQQTVKPLSERIGVAITVIDSQKTNDVIKQILTTRRGQTILIAGHNNSVPAIASELSGESFPVIPENEYDNMFVVTIYRFGKAKVLRLKYGPQNTQGGAAGMMVPPQN